MFFQRHLFSLSTTFALSMLAACSGGGTAPATPGTQAATPIIVPVSTPVPVAPAAVLATAQLNGSAGFINKISHTVYVFDADLSAAGKSTCAGQCSTVWPSIAVPAGTSVAAPFGVIVRSDGISQLTYSGRPLYTYIADSVPGSVAGDGINSFGAAWHIARPASTATAAPGASTAPSLY